MGYQPLKASAQFQVPIVDFIASCNESIVLPYAINTGISWAIRVIITSRWVRLLQLFLRDGRDNQQKKSNKSETLQTGTG